MSEAAKLAGRRSISRRRRWPVRLALHFVVVLGAVLFLFPFLWMLASSLKPDTEIFLIPPRLLPSAFAWSNYKIALERFDFFGGLANTMIIVVGVEIGRLLSVPMAAYAFARINFPFRRVLFILVLATMMLPYYATLIPQFIIFRDLHWINTFLPLIVPSFLGGGGGAFFLFLLRQFYLGLPREYDEAAMIDGCGYFKTFWHIILPQSKPALIVMIIFTFTTEWNDFFGPLIYLSSRQTVAVKFAIWVANATGENGTVPEPFSHILAISVILTAVPVVLFFCTQRYFLRGLTVAGITR